MHKQVCGTSEAEPRLLSQVAYKRAVDEMARHMVQGIPWDPMSKLYAECRSSGYL